MKQHIKKPTDKLLARAFRMMTVYNALGCNDNTYYGFSKKMGHVLVMANITFVGELIDIGAEKILRINGNSKKAQNAVNELRRLFADKGVEW